MAEPAYTVKALDESTWPAFAALVEHNNGVFGGCWCMGFHPERERPTRRSCSTEQTAWGGASSALPTRCRGSKAARRTRRAGRRRRTGGSPAATSARAIDARASQPRRSPVPSISYEPGRRDGRGIPGGRRLGACRLPVQRCSVDLREAGVHPRPQDRQAPLGRDEGGRVEVVGITTDPALQDSAA